MKNSCRIFILVAALEAGILSATAVSFRSQIVGGSEVDLGEVPYQAEFIFNDHYICGGAIYNKFYVLSAAHCFVGLPMREIWVAVGMITLSSNYDRRQILQIDDVIVHLGYSGAPQFSNDIALLKVDGHFQFSYYVKPIPLPSVNENFIGQICYVTGYGRTVVDNQIIKSDNLLKTETTVISDEICMNCHNKFFTQINEFMICAENSNHSGTAHGDAGGPLSCNGFLAGITSKLSHPDVFTEVSHYINWIDKNTQ